VQAKQGTNERICAKRNASAKNEIDTEKMERGHAPGRNREILFTRGLMMLNNETAGTQPGLSRLCESLSVQRQPRVGWGVKGGEAYESCDTQMFCAFHPTIRPMVDRWACPCVCAKMISVR